MNQPQRIFIVGHPGAGKALLAKTVAQELGWRYVDADLGLEFHIGRSLKKIVGEQGQQAFYDCQFDLLTSLCTQEHLVVTTDGSIVCSEKNRQLLRNEFTVFLEVSTIVQITRTSRSPAPLLLLENLQHFLDDLHGERDNFYQEVATLTIHGDNAALDEHVHSIIQAISGKEKQVPKLKPSLDKKDLILFHKERHTAVNLSKQQAITLKLLAEGKTAKDIARELHVSYRTVEGVIAKIMESLGCASSKELISLYHAQH